MKKLMTILLACSMGLALAEEKEFGHFNSVKYAKNGDIVTGEWNCQYTKARAYAVEKRLPMIIFWGNSGCTMCQSVEHSIGGQDEKAKDGSWQPTTNPSEFVRWQESNGIVMVFVVNGSVGGDEAKKVKSVLGSASSYPIIGFYWPKNGKDDKKYDARLTGVVSAKTIMNKAASVFEGYVPNLSVMGTFDVDDETETAFNRLEAEAAGPVAIRLTREDGGEAVDGTLEVSVAKANGPAIIPVHWAASDKQQQQFVEVTIPNGLSAGDEITLTLKDAVGEAENSAVIYYVAKAEKPTPTNPLWFGERNESTLEYGEWTMDLDTALAKVKNDGGYTLALVQGSQWCGDCYNVEQKFLSQTSSGVNVFCDWAEKHHVALAVIDVPKFATNTVETSYPSLLKRDAAEKELGGVKALRSGLAYLTRKGADREGGTAAADILERNRKLVQTNTKEFAYDDKHGFHRPEDSNAYRIGVPNFLLIRRDGTVAARLSRWAATTSGDEAIDPAKVNDYLKRFDEMLVIADKNLTEIENNYASSDSIPLDANGVKAEEASLSAADTRDVFHLTGFGGGALEKITVSGSNSVGKVKVAFVTLDADGKEKVVGTEKTENLSKAGFTLEHTFEPGDYYVRVSAADVTSKGDFAIGSTNENHFQWYSVKGEQILIPGEQEVTTKAPTSGKLADKLTVRLTSNETYRLVHMLSCDPTAALVPLAEAGENFYTAFTNGDVKITVDSTHTLTHQLWKSNTVGFVETSSTVSESVCDTDGVPLKLAVKRTGGVSGELTVKVSVNTNLTTLSNVDVMRYELRTSELTWADGDGADKFVEVLIEDWPQQYYGEGDIVLDLEAVTPPYGCGVTDGKSRYTLSVVEDDKAQPGKAMFSRVAPYAAKAKTIYVKEGDTGVVYAVRFEHSDGLAAVILKSSVKDVEFATANPRDLVVQPDGQLHFYWSNHESAEKPIYVSGVPAGKTAKITMTAYNEKGTPSKSQFKVHSSSNSVSVVGVAADCPEFSVGSQPYDLDRYVYFTNAIPLKAGTYTNSAAYANKQYQKTFTKLSGTLPSGLKAVWDKSNDNLAIFGIPTVKAGTYTAVYQVSEKRPSGKSTKNVAGLTVEIVFTVVDPVDTKQPGGALNPAAATSRTLSDLAVFGADEGGTVVRLAGTLQLTIPPTGKLSAKYVCTTGTVSLSAKSWAENGFDPVTCGLYAELAGSGKYKDYSLKVWVNKDYSVEGELHDPHFQSGDLGVFSDGKVWTKGSTSKTKPVPANTAENWAGYYTVALVPQNIVEERADSYTNTVAPRGTGYLTLKMDTASAWNAGKVTWAGMLPNGTTLSGSTVLTRGDDELIGTNTCVYLPVFKKTTTDIVGLVAEIEAYASTKENRRCVNDGIAVPYWKHLEKTADAKASYYMDLDVCGALYDKNEALNKCCMADGGVLHVDVEALGGWMYAGTPTNVTDVDVEVVTGKKPANDTMKVFSNDKKENPQSIKLSFNRSTGIVTGSFKLPYTTVDKGVTKEKTQSVNYKGIVLSGWDNCGDCGDPQPGDVFLPFVNGAYYFSDKLPYTTFVKSGKTQVEKVKTLSVKRGGGVTVKAIHD